MEIFSTDKMDFCLDEGERKKAKWWGLKYKDDQFFYESLTSHEINIIKKLERTDLIPEVLAIKPCKQRFLVKLRKWEGTLEEWLDSSTNWNYNILEKELGKICDKYLNLAQTYCITHNTDPNDIVYNWVDGELDWRFINFEKAVHLGLNPLHDIMRLSYRLYLANFKMGIQAPYEWWDLFYKHSTREEIDYYKAWSDKFANKDIILFSFTGSYQSCKKKSGFFSFLS